MTARADDCVFCEIVAGQGPVSAFYEDDVVLGFMTIGPVNDGHAMIIPKRRVAYLEDLDEAARAIQNAYGRLFSDDGRQ